MFWIIPSWHTDPICNLIASPCRWQMLSNKHTCVGLLLAGFSRKVSWLTALTKPSLFLTLTRYHLWEMQLFPAFIPLWISSYQRLWDSSFHRSKISSGPISHPRCGGTLRCNQLVLVWSQMPPAATKVPSSSWEPEPSAKRPQHGSVVHHKLRTSYQGSPEPVCYMVPLGSQWGEWFLHKTTCADLASALLLHSSFLDVGWRVSHWGGASTTEITQKLTTVSV